MHRKICMTAFALQPHQITVDRWRTQISRRAGYLWTRFVLLSVSVCFSQVSSFLYMLFSSHEYIKSYLDPQERGALRGWVCGQRLGWYVCFDKKKNELRQNLTKSVLLGGSYLKLGGGNYFDRIISQKKYYTPAQPSARHLQLKLWSSASHGISRMDLILHFLRLQTNRTCRHRRVRASKGHKINEVSMIASPTSAVNPSFHNRTFH